MGDGLKINNEKRHRSSSSLTGVLESVRSEKRLDVRASIPEVEDQYAIAETRCDSLQEKIDLVKAFKRKKKLKKRSMTTITEPVSNIENVPMITIRTRPKKKSPQQPEKFSKASNVMHGYVDPDLIEQRRMISRVQEQSPKNKQQYRQSKMKPTRDYEKTQQPNFILHRNNTDDDSEPDIMSEEVARGGGGDKSVQKRNYKPSNKYNTKGYPKLDTMIRKPGSDDGISVKSRETLESHSDDYFRFSRAGEDENQNSAKQGRKKALVLNSAIKNDNDGQQRELVELFKKNEKPFYQAKIHDVVETNNFQNGENVVKINRKVSKFRPRHYELPTLSSKLKKTILHAYPNNTQVNNIPFVISKSSAPSHNIGLNLQQVLNGVKLQQPVSNIPLTIAHHMGLRHIPVNRMNCNMPTLSSDQINTIQLGEKFVHLPSYKKISYGRLLSLYRNENSTVSRFLRTVGRPHCYHTSLYDLSTKQEDFDGATSKAQGRQDAKQNLAEYASLYRQYEQVEKQLNENYDPILQKHKDILLKKLTERENYIRKLVGDTGAENDDIALGASVSATEDDYRQSMIKLQQAT